MCTIKLERERERKREQFPSFNEPGLVVVVVIVLYLVDLRDVILAKLLLYS